MGDMMSVMAFEHNQYPGFILSIPFKDWHIEIELKDGDDSKVRPDMSIFDENCTDVTEDFCDFHPEAQTFNPTGENLACVFMILGNYYERKKKNA